MLLSPLGPGDVYRTLVGPDDRQVTMVRVEPGADRTAWDLMSEEPNAAIVGAGAGLTLGFGRTAETVVAAMVAPVMNLNVK